MSLSSLTAGPAQAADTRSAARARFRLRGGVFVALTGEGFDVAQ